MFTLADILAGLAIALILFSLLELELGEQPMVVVNSKPDKSIAEKVQILPYAPINANTTHMSFSKRQEAAPHVSKPVDFKTDIQIIKGPSLDVEVAPSRHSTDPQIDIRGVLV